jgi:hypothetical protein
MPLLHASELPPSPETLDEKIERLRRERIEEAKVGKLADVLFPGIWETTDAPRSTTRAITYKSAEQAEDRITRVWAERLTSLTGNPLADQVILQIEEWAMTYVQREKEIVPEGYVCQGEQTRRIAIAARGRTREQAAMDSPEKYWELLNDVQDTLNLLITNQG